MSSSPKVLPLGVRIIYDGDTPVRVEVPLNKYFTRKDDHRHKYQHAWAKVVAAITEARSTGVLAVDVDHPIELVGWLRRWFRDNYDLYEIIEDRKGDVVLVIRNGMERLMVITTNQSGTNTYTPVSRWVIEVTPK